ncbi:MAG: endo,4-beta-xylanase, partial [bacterium]
MEVRGSVRRVGMLAALALAVAPPTAGARDPAPARGVPLGKRGAPLRPRRRPLRDTFLREFNSLTPENELKMDALQPRRGGYDFAAADKLVRFARRNGKAVRGHTLIWGQALPLWLVDHGALGVLGLRLPPIALPPLPSPLGKLVGDTTTLLTGWRRDELLAAMKDHIRTVMRPFAGTSPSGTSSTRRWRRTAASPPPSGGGSSERTTSPRRCARPAPR